MLFDCLWVVVDVFGLNTGNTGKPFFKILNEYSSSPAILKLSGKGHMPCQSLEIRQVVQQDNQPPEPEEPQEPRKTTRTKGTTRTTRTRRTRELRELGTRRRAYVTKSNRPNVTSDVAITLETSLFLRWLLNFSRCL